VRDGARHRGEGNGPRQRAHSCRQHQRRCCPGQGRRGSSAVHCSPSPAARRRAHPLRPTSLVHSFPGRRVRGGHGRDQDDTRDERCAPHGPRRIPAHTVSHAPPRRRVRWSRRCSRSEPTPQRTSRESRSALVRRPWPRAEPPQARWLRRTGPDQAEQSGKERGQRSRRRVPHRRAQPRAGGGLPGRVRAEPVARARAGRGAGPSTLSLRGGEPRSGVLAHQGRAHTEHRSERRRAAHAPSSGGHERRVRRHPRGAHPGDRRRGGGRAGAQLPLRRATQGARQAVRRGLAPPRGVARGRRRAGRLGVDLEWRCPDRAVSDRRRSGTRRRRERRRDRLGLGDRARREAARRGASIAASTRAPSPWPG
jgi:hypothetical protein